MKIWGQREKTRTQVSSNGPLSSDRKDPAEVALTLSKRLIIVVKARGILNIEAGLEMIALAMAISSEVCDGGFFKIPDFNISPKEQGAVSGNGGGCQNCPKKV